MLRASCVLRRIFVHDADSFELPAMLPVALIVELYSERVWLRAHLFGDGNLAYNFLDELVLRLRSPVWHRPGACPDLLPGDIFEGELRLRNQPDDQFVAHSEPGLVDVVDADNDLVPGFRDVLYYCPNVLPAD